MRNLLSLANKALIGSTVAAVVAFSPPCRAQTDLQRGLQEYENGKFVVAALHLRRAATHGDAQAQELLGVMYAMGAPAFAGIHRNPREAVKWLEMASRQGRQSAQYLFCVLFRPGHAPRASGVRCFDHVASGMIASDPVRAH
ncbi:MAG TPA: hypothetical protein VM491_02085 [Burkholderiaceae bacterium]|nr:hypothetical protein [Burkholderiaceae bacterium]